MTTNYPIRGLFGCEPDKYSTNLLNINPGLICDFYGASQFELPTQTQIDLTRNGCWGLDAGAISAGELYVYFISNSATGDQALIASKQKYSGDVVVPAGYVVNRKLPWGVIYNPAWDGIPNFHLTHWPLPEIRLTDAEYSGLWMPLGGASAANWTDLDLSGYLPDNARLAHLMIEVRYNSGSAGSGYVRSYGGQTTGLLVGSGSPGSPLPGPRFVPIRTDSNRHIQYKTTGSVQMYVQVIGYSMTEPA